MSAPAKTEAQSQAEEEYAKAFAIARQALGYVGTFRTPPTPEIYELWYRYVEGSHRELGEKLDYVVHEAKTVDAAQLKQLHMQLFGTADATEINQRVSRDLSREMGALQQLIRKQMSENDEFSSSVRSVSESLESKTITVADMRTCVANTLTSNTRMQQQLLKAGNRLEESQRQVEQLRADLQKSQRLAMSDPLTGAGNRRFFELMLLEALQRSYDSAQLQFLVLMDLDRFKHINDTFGHQTGDEVLQFVVASLQQLAADHPIARYGGDEFAIVCGGINETEVSTLGESICRFFSEKSLTVRRTAEPIGKLTVSMGVAMRRTDDDRHSWFDRADKLLYSAKSNGRNCMMLERNLTRQ